MSLFSMRFGRAFAVAALFSAMPLQAALAQPSDMPTKTMSGKAMNDPAKSERRIKDLHDTLRITAAQEELWGNVAQTMRDNDKARQAGWADKAARGKTMNAADSLKFMQIMTDQHASGLKQLVPQFEALYAALSPEQKKQADKAFAKHQRGEDRRRCGRE
jgi:hypothetical protein